MNYGFTIPALNLLLACGIVLLLVPVFGQLATRYNWVDRPDTRKRHSAPVPYSGGIAILVASIINYQMLPWPNASLGLILSILLIFVVGFLDDRFPVRARYRFLAQMIAAFVAVVGTGVALTNLGTTFSADAINLGVLAIPFTVICIVGVTNAFNMSDGADGLCGGYSLISLSSLLLAGWLIQQDQPASFAHSMLIPMIVPLLGGLIGFLFYNLRSPILPRAVSFLGDGGSMTLGFIISVTAIWMVGREPGGMPPVTAIWIIALPLTDMFACICSRVLRGERPMTADSFHMHHLLQEKGFSTRATVAILHAMAFVMAGVGILAWRLQVSEYWMFWGLMTLFTVYLAYSHAFWVSQRGWPKPVFRTVFRRKGGLRRKGG